MPSQTVCYDREKILAVLRDIESIVVSLDRIGSAHHKLSKAEYDRLSSEYLDDWKVACKLADARKVLSEAFSEDVGADGMDELERDLGEIAHWTLTKPKP